MRGDAVTTCFGLEETLRSLFALALGCGIAVWLFMLRYISEQALKFLVMLSFLVKDVLKNTMNFWVVGGFKHGDIQLHGVRMAAK